MTTLNTIPLNAGTLTPALKASWLDDLRSGKYQQDRQFLRTDIGYCCLGVLAIVAGVPACKLGGGAATLDDVGQQDLLGAWRSSEHDTRFSFEDPTTHTTLQRKLAAMNDSGMSFSDIADWIEANL